MADGSKLDRAVSITQLVSNLSIFVAIALSIMAYLQNERAQRSENTFDYVKEFNSERLLEQREVLRLLWKGQELEKLQGQTLPAEVVSGLVRKLIETQPGDAAHKAIIQIALFYDEAAQCVALSTCDQAQLLGFLGEYGQDFICLYKDELKILRRTTLAPNLGRGFDALGIGGSECYS